MSNTCTRRPARIHYLNYATSNSIARRTAAGASRESASGYKFNFDRIVKAKKFTFSCTFKIKKTLFFKGGIIACTQRAGILVIF